MATEVRFRCVICGKLTAQGRKPSGGDGTARFPRFHRDTDGKPCEGNYRYAEWVEPDTKGAER